MRNVVCRTGVRRCDDEKILTLTLSATMALSLAACAKGVSNDTTVETNATTEDFGGNDTLGNDATFANDVALDTNASDLNTTDLNATDANATATANAL